MVQTPEVRTYILQDDGTLEPFEIYPLESYGCCPDVGDTIFKQVAVDIIYTVQRRYFIEIPGSKPGWAIVVREVEKSPQMERVLAAWKEDDQYDEPANKPDEETFLEDLRRRLITSQKSSSPPKTGRTSKRRPKLTPEQPRRK